MDQYKAVFLTLTGGADTLSLSSLQRYFAEVGMQVTEMECAQALRVFTDSDDLTQMSIDAVSSKEGLVEEVKNLSIDCAKFTKLVDFFLEDTKITDDINQTASRVYGSNVKLLVDALKKEK